MFFLTINHQIPGDSTPLWDIQNKYFTSQSLKKDNVI